MLKSTLKRQDFRHAIGWIQGVALLLFVTTSAWGAIATDATVSTNRSGFLPNIVSPAFSTASANELLLAFVSTDATSPGITVTGVTGAGLTWNLVRRTNVQLGTSEIWRAFAANRLSNVTVQANLSQSVAASLTVVSFTGVDSSGTNGSGAIGATGSGNANPGAPTASLVTTRGNSWIFGVGNDWDRAIARTVPNDQALVNQYLATVGDTYWMQRQSAPTPAGGTTVTISNPGPATDRYNLTIVEVLAAPASGAGSTVSGAITPSTLGSDATLTLSQGGTTVSTATAASNGSYSFAGVANGTYTVTPSKAGIAFSPASRSVTVSGTNATVAAFTATTVPSVTSTVSGAITPSSFGSGATVTLSQGGTTVSTAIADTNGSYSFAGVANGTYTVTASKAGIDFSPASRSVTVSGTNATIAAFTATSSGTISSDGIATDATVSTNRSGFLPNIVSPAFSTASANELLLAFVSTDATSPGITVTGVTGAGLTWNLVRRTNAQLGTSEIWRAFAANRLSNVTVQANLSQSVAASLTVVSFTGVDSSGTNGSGAIGATGSGNANPGAPTASLVTTRGNSWVFGVGNDWDRPIARTVPNDQALVNQYLATVGDTYWMQRQSAPTPASGTTVTISNPGPATDRYNLTIVEVLAAPASGAGSTVSGAITPSTLGSDATVILSQNGTTVSTAIAASNGNYSFAGVASGTYTVTPSKAGIAFSPVSRSVTVSGTNATVAAFTATAVPGVTSTVSGALTPSSFGNGATVTLSQGGTTVSTATAASNGSYSFAGVANGTYTVTASKAGIAFSPASRGVTVGGTNATVAAFTATAAVSGTISPVGTGAGTLVVLVGANLTLTKTADSSGNFSFTDLQPGGYTVTPSKTGYTFIPASRTVTISSGSITANFTASGSATNLTVNGAQRFQTMDGMGVNINVNSWNNGELKPALDFFIATNGSTLFRVIRDPLDWVAREELIPALHALDPSTLQQVYETAKMQDIWKTIGYLNQQGIEGSQIILNFMGWTPSWLGGGGSYGVASYITPGKEQEFATMIASLVYYGKTVKGLDFTYLTPMNEQDWNCLEGPCVTSTQYTTILHELADELNTMGVVDMRFVGPDTANVGASISYISQMMADSTVAGLTDHLALHDYGSSPVSPGTAYPGKNYWFTETSAWCSTCDAGGDGPPNEWSFAVQTCDLALGDIRNGFAAVLLWEGYDSYWYHHNASSLWGLLAYDSDTGLYTPRKRAYANAQLNHFIRAGDIVIRSSESIASVPAIVTVYNPATGKAAIIGRNSGNSPITINGQLLDLPAMSTLALYETNPSMNLSRKGDVSVAGGFFTAQISADSIFTLTNQSIDQD
jgi:hypothetical protein